jgi:hypothetical protein
LAAGWLRGFPGDAPLASLVSSLSGVLDPYQSPGPALVASVVLVLAPPLLGSWYAARPSGAVLMPSAGDAARLYGASLLARRRLLAIRPLRVLCGRFILACALAATNVTPALLFQPWSDQRTLAPGVLELAEGPGDARLQAAALALCAVALNLAALAAARLTGSIGSPEGNE